MYIIMTSITVLLNTQYIKYFSTQGRKQATDWNCDFIESSAKNNENIREIFETVIKKIDKDLGVSHDNKEGKCSVM